VDLLSKPGSLEKAIGVSVRTLQRRKANPGKLLSPEQSGRTWKFAEIVSRATAVFGSSTAAEQWLERPAIGLDRRRPIDLLATPAGIEIVESYLERIHYGVYT
jgi:putative toxin-antitoxin system antitoxin component (TIGR02293 family)